MQGLLQGHCRVLQGRDLGGVHSKIKNGKTDCWIVDGFLMGCWLVCIQVIDVDKHIRETMGDKYL